MYIPKAQLQNPKRFSQNTLFYCPFDFAKTSWDLHEKKIELYEKHINLHEKHVWISRRLVEPCESSEIPRSRFQSIDSLIYYILIIILLYFQMLIFEVLELFPIMQYPELSLNSQIFTLKSTPSILELYYFINLQDFLNRKVHIKSIIFDSNNSYAYLYLVIFPNQNYQIKYISIFSKK